MKISKRAQYGLRAMVHLSKNSYSAKNKTAVSIREISNIEGIPFEFLSRFFADLEKAKLVKAKHGANGGYFLARPASKITAGNIVEALDGKINPVQCSLCQKSKKCLSKNVWDKVKQSLSNTLYSITLKDLIN